MVLAPVRVVHVPVEGPGHSRGHSPCRNARGQDRTR